jgi:exosortase
VNHRPTARPIANAGLVAGLAALFVWLYAGTIKGLALEWASSPDSSYGAILATVAAAIVWQRRKLLAESIRDNRHHSAFAFFVLLLGALAYLVGLLGADVFVTRVSAVIVLAGAVWFLTGDRAARLLAAPLAFLLIAVPLPALVVNAITLPLQLVASRLAETLLAAGGVPVFRDGNILELRSTSLEVAEACSGLRSLISLAGIGCLIAWATERSVIRRASVVAAAVPIAIVLNGVRVAATGVACEIWGRQAATGGWHTFSGWLTFVVAVFVLAQCQRLMPRARRPEPAVLSPTVVSS